MKKPEWANVSVTLKTIYLTPVIAFMALAAFNFPNGGWYEYIACLKIIFVIVTIVALLGLLTVFVVDIVRNKKNQSKKTGWLSCFLYLSIPMIWFIAVTVLIILVIINPYYEGEHTLEGFSRSYIIGFLCLMAAFVIDRAHKENRVTPDYLFYSLYFAIPVIWFIISLSLSLLSAGFRLY